MCIPRVTASSLQNRSSKPPAGRYGQNQREVAKEQSSLSSFLLARLSRRYMSDAKSNMDKSVAIFIFNKKGEILLQRRAADDDSYPLCLDFSAAGGIESEESKDIAAARELREELGI